MVITLREAGGSSCSETDQTVHCLYVVPMWFPPCVAWKWCVLGRAPSHPSFSSSSVSPHSFPAFLPPSCPTMPSFFFPFFSFPQEPPGTHMPPQGTQNSISHSLLESPIPWPWGMASCQCSLSSVLCPLSVAFESGGWRGELEDSWMQASLLGSGEFLAWNSLTCVLATP